MISLCRYPDSNVHGASMGPTWALSAPDGPHIGPWTLLSGYVTDADVYMAIDLSNLNLNLESSNDRSWVTCMTPRSNETCFMLDTTYIKLRLGRIYVSSGACLKKPQRCDTYVSIYTNTYSKFQTMMTSPNGNIFRVTGHLCGEFTGPRWISYTKPSNAELWFFLWSTSE